MNIIKDIEYKNRYTDDIIETEYIQQKIKNNIKKEVKEIKQITKVIFKTLEELILCKYDYKCLEIKNILDIEKRKIEIATLIEEEQEKMYNNFNYDKKFSKRFIQNNLQETDTLSSIIYISDLYNLTPIIYDKAYEKFYKLSVKENNNKFYVEYYDHSFRMIEKPDEEFKDIKYEKTIDGLTNIINCNIKDINIYKKFLKPISNYKINELITIADELNIDKNNKGKKLVKKELYDAINFFKVNNI